MRVVMIALGALAGGIVGAAAGMFLLLTFGSALGLSDFEGERAMTAAFLGGPVGAGIGAALGVMLVRRLLRA